MNGHAMKDATSPARTVQRVTLWGLVVNLFLAAVKFAAGFLGSSHALVADAVHSLSDSATDIAVLVGAPFWSAPADSEHPHGHGRIETMVTLLIGLALGSVGIGLVYNALASIQRPDPLQPGWLAFTVACVSVVGKEALYQWTARVGKRLKSSAVIANAWHHRSDAFSSVPVAVAVIGMKVRPDWTFLDHLAAVIVSLLILQATWWIVWPTLKQLSDTGATRAERNRIMELAGSTDGVRALHALRTRHVGPGLHIDLHVQVDPELSVHDGHRIAGIVKKRLLQEGPDVVDVLIHLEPYEPECARQHSNPE